MIVGLIAVAIGAAAMIYETFQTTPSPAIFCAGLIVAFVAAVALADGMADDA